jgi:hypothetical protein
MSYKRMGYQGEVWVEDRCRIDGICEIARLYGLVEAKDQQIARLEKQIEEKHAPEHPLVPLDAEHQKLRG